MIHKMENDIELILKVAECRGMECFSWLRAASGDDNGTETWGLQRQEFLEKLSVA